MSTSTRVVVITAGVSVPSSTQLLGERLAAAVTQQRPEASVSMLLVKDHATAITNYVLTGVPSAELRTAMDEVAGADAVIAVTPVFNASYSGLFKLFFDAMDEKTLAGKPVLLGATGGTARHSLVIDQAMLPLFHYLKAFIVPTGVFAATADWGSSSTGLQQRIDRSVEQLLDWTDRIPSTTPVDEFADVVDFSHLLGN